MGGSGRDPISEEKAKLYEFMILVFRIVSLSILIALAPFHRHF